jgi:hypothetical protein
MVIMVDTREHTKERERVKKQLQGLGAETIESKLYVGDYMSLDDARLCIDRKKDLIELCGNVTQQHERFRAELVRAQKAGIKLVILVEHGRGIERLSDVYFWHNPRRKTNPKATEGSQLYKSLCTMRDRYDVSFVFCRPSETGEKIIEILGGSHEG